MGAPREQVDGRDATKAKGSRAFRGKIVLTFGDQRCVGPPALHGVVEGSPVGVE